MWSPLNRKNTAWAYKQGRRKAGFHDKKKTSEPPTKHFKQFLILLKKYLKENTSTRRDLYLALYFACNCACDNWQGSQLTMFTKQIFIEFSVEFIQVFLGSLLLRRFFLFFLSISQRLSHINIINLVSSYFRFIFFLCVVIGCILKPVNQVLPLWFLFNCQTFPSKKRSSADPI